MPKFRGIFILVTMPGVCGGEGGQGFTNTDSKGQNR